MVYGGYVCEDCGGDLSSRPSRGLRRRLLLMGDADVIAEMEALMPWDDEATPEPSSEHIGTSAEFWDHKHRCEWEEW